METQPDRLDRIEQVLGDVSELVLAHDEILKRIEQSLATLTDRTAITDDRVTQILEYLFRERPNGRGTDAQS